MMKRKTRKTRKAKEVVVGETTPETLLHVAPMKAKPLVKMVIYDKMPMNKFTTFKYGEYVFKFDTNLVPVPVKVPSDIADILLQMVDADCTCHHTTGEPKKLFREV